MPNLTHYIICFSKCSFEHLLQSSSPLHKMGVSLSFLSYFSLCRIFTKTPCHSIYHYLSYFCVWKYFRYDQSLVELFNAAELIKISRCQPWNMTIDFPKPNWLMTINNRLDFFRQQSHTHLWRGGGQICHKVLLTSILEIHWHVMSC